MHVLNVDTDCCSTVSKVLSHRDKYLPRDQQREKPRPRSASKRDKGRKKEVERVLSNWARKQKKTGLPLSDLEIRVKAGFFAASCGGDVSNPALDAKWLEKFKRRHASGAGSSKAPIGGNEDIKSGSNSASSSEQPSSLSPEVDSSFDLVDLLEAGTSQEQMMTSSVNSTAAARKGSRSRKSKAAKSASSNASDTLPLSSASFDASAQNLPVPATTQSFLSPHIMHGHVSNVAYRPRSNTLPALDHYSNLPDASGSNMSTILATPVLDSQMGGYTDLMHNYDNSPHLDTTVMPDRPTTVSPSDVMRAPILPEPNRLYATDPLSMGPQQLNDAKRPRIRVLSRWEARNGVETAIEFLENQTEQNLDMQEALLLGRVLLEKLQGPLGP